MIPVRDLFSDQPVNPLVLQEQDGVRVADGRFEQSLGVGRHARHDHLEAWHVGVERLDRLRVVQPAVYAAAERSPDDDGHRVVAVGPVPRPRGLADDLVERRMDEVGELDLGDWDQAVERGADGDADDA